MKTECCGQLRETRFCSSCGAGLFGKVAMDAIKEQSFCLYGYRDGGLYHVREGTLELSFDCGLQLEWDLDHAHCHPRSVRVCLAKDGRIEVEGRVGPIERDREYMHYEVEPTFRHVL